ncbi:Nn.00g021080.m01.CDS01 [Neocucurbitaria sp. VM-36]
MSQTQLSSFYEDLGFDELENVFSLANAGPEQNSPLMENLSYSNSLEAIPSPTQDKADNTWPHEPLRDRLVHLFFRHVYPMCPVVDEPDFNQLYLASSYATFFRRFPAGLFQAMMFAAVQAINTGGATLLLQHRKEPFRTTDKDAEPNLARMALLLSYWCPQGMAAGINSHWIDRAIYHTKVALAEATSNSPIDTHDLRVIYWSCVVRNTLVSFALRRPARLQPIQTSFGKPDELLQCERKRTKSGHFTAQLLKMHVFIWTCKICEILNPALLFLRQATLSSNWICKASETVNSADPDEQFRCTSLTVESLQLLHVQNIELQLTTLSSKYDQKLGLAAGNSLKGRLPNDEISGSFYLNRIITLSSITTLYGCLFDITPSTGARGYHEGILRKMEIYSNKVAMQLQEALHNLDPAQVPVAM